MAIQWKEEKAKDRLIAALIAASANVNMKEVARFYGNGATYDAVEGQLRKAKKLAKDLQAEANGRSGPAKAASRASNTSLAKSSVKGAHVSKTKKAATIKIKTEVLEETSYGTNEDETEV